MISIVIPVHNGEGYLRKCVDSILNNTYRDIEVIIVENGSTDGTLKLSYEIAHTDSRVSVISSDIPSVAHARNLGLSAAKGEWLTFVDSDDYVSPYLYETLIKCAAERDYDFVFCDYIMGDRLDYVFETPKNTQGIRMSKDDYYRNTYLRAQYKFSVTWNKIIKRAVIGDILHDERLQYIEDRNFVIKCVANAKACCYVDEPLYYYWRGNTSAVTKQRNNSKRVAQVRCTQADLSFFQVNYPEQSNWQEYVSANLLQMADFQYRKAKEENLVEIQAEIKPIIKYAAFAVRRARGLGIRTKLRFLLEHDSPTLFLMAFRLVRIVKHLFGK